MVWSLGATAAAFSVLRPPVVLVASILGFRLPGRIAFPLSFRFSVTFALVTFAVSAWLLTGRDKTIIR